VWDEVEKERRGVMKKKVVKSDEMKEEKMEKGKKLARQLLAMLMQKGVTKRSEIKRILADLRIGEVEGKLLGRWLKDGVEEKKKWIDKLPEELKKVAEECYLMEIERGVEDKGMIGVAVELGREKLREERSELVEELRKAEEKGREKKVDELSERLMWLDQKERSILGYLA